MPKTNPTLDLFDAVADIDDPKQCKAFLSDLLSDNELVMAKQRWEIAKLLHQGKTYGEIAKKVHASTSTITRVNAALTGSGSSRGFKAVLDRLLPNEEPNGQ